MSEVLLDVIMDTIKDTAVLVPFLFVTYIAMEWLEERTEEHSVRLLSSAKKPSHLLGAGIGLIPQCGFSAAAASLYAGGVISLGTMLSVFLSTSDEMLPIFISSSVGAPKIAKILVIKFAIALVSGIIVDLVLGKLSHKEASDKHIHDLCEQDACGCEEEGGGIVRSAAVHTIKIVIFIFIISFVLGLVLESVGKEAVEAMLTQMPIAGILICGLIGLVPNCAASVVIAELYLEGLLSSGQMMSGLLVAAGVGVLVLARTNRHAKENATIIILLYIIGVCWGILIDAFHVTF